MRDERVSEGEGVPRSLHSAYDSSCHSPYTAPLALVAPEIESQQQKTCRQRRVDLFIPPFEANREEGEGIEDEEILSVF